MSMHHLSESVLGMYALEPAVVSNRAEVEAHLAACHECRSALEAVRIFDAALGDADAWPSKVTEAGHSAAVDQLRAFAARCAEEDREALRLLAEYEQPDAAPRFVWADLPNKPEFQTGGVARLLCKRANGMCTRKPLYALVLAEAAVRISEELPDASYPRSTIHELRGEAWKEQANALVSLGRFDEALEALARAEGEYRKLPHEGIGLIAVWYVRASVFSEQEQSDDAEKLARRSAEAALHLGATDRYMRAQHLQAEIRFNRGDIPAAADLFASVLHYGELQNDLLWIARESHNLGICNVELGNVSEASRYLSNALRLFTQLNYSAEITRTNWTIARLGFLQGNPGEAVRRLRDVIRALTSDGMLTDAALAAVHLAEMLDAVDRRREIPKLLDGVVQIFISAGKLTGALAALAYLKRAAIHSSVGPELFAYVRKFIAHADRQPELLFVPPEPEPPL